MSAIGFFGGSFVNLIFFSISTSLEQHPDPKHLNFSYPLPSSFFFQIYFRLSWICDCLCRSNSNQVWFWLKKKGLFFFGQIDWKKKKTKEKEKEKKIQPSNLRKKKKEKEIDIFDHWPKPKCNKKFWQTIKVRWRSYPKDGFFLSKSLVQYIYFDQYRHHHQRRADCTDYFVSLTLSVLSVFDRWKYSRRHLVSEQSWSL